MEQQLHTRAITLPDQLQGLAGYMSSSMSLHASAFCLPEPSCSDDADEIGELRRRENEMQVEPDWEIDAFMKASVRHGKRHNIRTDYTLRLLGLEVSAVPQGAYLVAVLGHKRRFFSARRLAPEVKSTELEQRKGNYAHDPACGLNRLETDMDRRPRFDFTIHTLSSQS